MSKSKKRVSWKVSAIALVVLCILGYLFVLSYQNAQRLVFDVKAVDETYGFMQEIENLMSDLRDTEAANNAYVLLGKERYLLIYHTDTKRVHTQLNKVEEIMRKYNFKSDADVLKDLVNRKIQDMDEAAAQREDRGLNNALQVYLTGDWQWLSDEIQKEMDSIQEKERKLLAGLDEKKADSIHKTEETLFSGLLVGMLVFIFAYIVVRREIIKRLEREELLEVAQSEALRASAFKSQFLANMSHEIRTPMNGILGMATVLLETRLDRAQEKYAGIIKRSCEALLRIVNDILDLSKVEAGKISLLPEKFNLPSLLKEIELLFKQTAEHKKIAFEMKGEKNLPPNVVGDHGRLRQILSNLIGNALKFTSTGSVTVTSTIMKSAGGHHKIRFEITDTGVGISSENQKNLFEAFQQGDPSVMKQFGGTGLGLNISKKLVEAMGGDIGFSSQPGRGSTFWFELDFVNGEEVALNEVKDVSEMVPDVSPQLVVMAVKKQSVRKKQKILIADDSEVNHDLLKIFLKNEDYELEFVSDGGEAIEKFRKSSFDLILMDMNMPVVDGLRAVKEIRNLERTSDRAPVKILAFTAGVTENEVNAALKGGCDGYISKPIEREKCLSAIKDHLTPRQTAKVA